MTLYGFLLGLTLFSQTPTGWIPATEKVESTVLFEEHFEDLNALSSWRRAPIAGDRHQEPIWRLLTPELVPGPQPGVLAAETRTPEGECLTINRLLLTPPLNTGENDRIRIKISSKFEELPQKGPPIMQAYLLTPADAESILLGQRTQFDPVAINPTEDWFEIETPQIPLDPGTDFLIGLRIASDSNICGLLAIDHLIVEGDTVAATENCDLGPNTLAQITKPVDTPPDKARVSLSEEINVSATVCGETAGYSFIWNVIHAATGNMQTLPFTGPDLRYQFETLGIHVLQVAAQDGEGNLDPTPVQLVFDVVQAHNLQTEILSPTKPMIRARAGETISFTAGVRGDPIEGVTFLWKRIKQDADRDLECYQGETVEISFPESGLYEVLCHGVDASGHEERTPSVRQVLVSEQGVHVTITGPEKQTRDLLVSLNEPVTFTGTVEDTAGLVKSFAWINERVGVPLCEGQTSCDITFNEPGPTAVALIAIGQDDQPLDGDFMRVMVEPPLYLNILKPERRQEIPINESFVLSGELQGSLLEELPDTSEISLSWNFNGATYQGAEVTVPGVDKAGHYQAHFIARHQASGEYIDRRVDLRIYDPNQQDEPEILHPRTDIHIPVGGSVFFDSSFRGALSSAKNAYWQITKVEDGSLIKDGTGATLGRVTFEDDGFYEANLFQAGERGDVQVDTRTIQVGTVDADIFSDNDDIDRAASLNAGRYEGFTLDTAHYYEIAIPNDDQQARITVEVDGQADLVVVDQDGDTVFSRRIFGTKSIQVPRLKAGVIRMGLIPVAGAKKNLSFSFGIDVLNPALFFSDIAEDSTFTTAVGIVNTTTAEASVEIIAYDATGNILEKVPKTIAGQGNYHDSVESLFPDVFNDISWIRVDSTHDVAGYSRTVSRDDMEAYGVDAGEFLYSELYVPHIATDTTTWSTKANLVNGNAAQADPQMVAGAATEQLNNSSSYAKDSFDFKEKLGGEIPSTTRWGLFFESGNTLSLSGNEVFSKVDGTRQSAGLGLASAPADNPSLTTDFNTLYFAHIARRTDLFWTALALVNIAGAEQNAQITSYGPGGVQVGTKTITLAADEKVVELAESFLAGIGSPSEVDWVQVTADSGIVGYELFGTHDTKQMAGLEAVAGTKTELCFPFVDPTGESWHGIALVNVGDQPATATYTLYTASGTVAGTAVTLEIAAKEKKSLLLTEIFGEIPLNAGWLSVTSTQPMAGFQLFGTNTFEHMSGLVAQ